MRSLVDDGTGGCCVLTGPAGIGKTALAQEAVARAEATGAQVLRARGSELEGALSFGAVRDLLAPHVLRLPSDERDALLQGPASFARPVLGLGSAGDGDPLYGLFWLTVALAEQRPLVLAVDDLHWLDLESALFCTYVARRIEGLPILLLATAQTHHTGPVAEAVDHLLEVARRLEPGPLEPDTLGELVPGQPPAEIHRLTGGNPMLAVELARGLAADPGADVSSVSLPGLGTGILKRVTGLTSEALELARALALSPTPLGLADVAALAGLDERSAAAAADALVRAEVLEWSDHRLGFLHPLMRRAVYDDLDPVGRQGAHHRAAEVLRARGAGPETVAAQLLASAPRADGETVRTLVDAADEAAARLAPRAVASYLTRAVAEPPGTPEERVRLRHRLGRVLLDLGRNDAVDVLAEAFEEVADRERLAVAVDLALAHLAVGRSDRAAELLRPLLTVPPTTDEQLDAAATWLLAVADVDPGQTFDAGIPADLPGTTPVQRRALIALAVHRQVSGARADEIRPLLARAAGDLGSTTLFDEAAWQIRALTTEFEDLQALAEAEARRARRTGEAARYATSQMRLGINANQRGLLRDAEALLRLGLESPDFEGWWRFSLESWLITTLSMQGRFEEAEALLATTLTRTSAGDVLQVQLDGRRAELAMDRGDYAAVIGPAERAVAAITDGYFSGVACDLAIALAAVGQRERAETLGRRMLDAAERLEHPQSVGMARAALGQVVGGEEGLGLLRLAVDGLRDTPYRWNQANAEVALGTALRAAGRRSEAREVLASALEYAVANDAAPIEEAAREELRLCGARPRRTARTGAAALTPSEERIARLAAEGRSNKEIAQHLFVTVKNVEMHLVHAYRKLGVSSRRDLAGVLSDPVASG